jgi:hypothetical protein
MRTLAGVKDLESARDAVGVKGGWTISVPDRGAIAEQVRRMLKAAFNMRALPSRYASVALIAIPNSEDGRRE